MLHFKLNKFRLCKMFTFGKDLNFHRYNHPEVVTILEANGALDCNWPPHSIISGVDLKTSTAQCYSLM